MRFALVLLALVLVIPSAAAQQVRLWLEPRTEETEGEPGERLYLEYRWNVQFLGTTCQDGTEFGVDFFPNGPSPIYGGASFVPQASLARYPNVTSGATTLELFLADTAPAGNSTTFELGTGLGMQNAGGCTPEPTRREETAQLTLTILETQATEDGPGEGGNGVPAPTFLLAVAAALSALARRRRG